MDADFFQIRKKSPFSIRKYPDTSGRSLSLNELRAKKKKLDELINIPTMAEERSFIQISRLGPKIRTSRQAQPGIRAKIHS